MTSSDCLLAAEGEAVSHLLWFLSIALLISALFPETLHHQPKGVLELGPLGLVLLEPGL